MAQFFKPGKTQSSRSAQASPSRPTIIPSVHIERYTDDGRGLARLTKSHSDKLHGKTVFVRGALADETVSISLDAIHSRYCEAHVSQVEQPSPQRLTPKCQHYAQCGGCHTQHMATTEQQHFKQYAVLRQLNEWAEISPDMLAPTISAEPFSYRRRIKLSVDNRGKEAVLGFRQHNSRKLVSINECSVMEPALEAMLEPLQSWFTQNRPSIGHVEMVLADNTVVVIVRYLRALSANLRQQLMAKLSQATQPYSLECLFQGKPKGECEAVLEDAQCQTHFPTSLFYSLKVSSREEAYQLHFRPQDFIQANGRVNELMVDQAISWLAPQAHEHILDCFCGMGNFSIPIAPLVASVQAYEGVEELVQLARDNAERNSCSNVNFQRRDLFDCEQLPQSDMLSQPCDGLILDPPRAGAKLLCEKIASIMPKRILYISCNPATFTRDAQSLCNQGYRLSRLGMIDMFPQTYHSEVMALFVLPSCP